MGNHPSRAFLVCAALAASTLAIAQQPATPQSANPAAENAKYVAEIKVQIAGREKSPAKEVFKNLKLMGDQPAERLLAIMETGYAKSLGVSCTHCHVPGKWDSDEKVAKQIAREMSALSRNLREQLKGIEALGSRNPAVNCTTCHRGALKPATSL